MAEGIGHASLPIVAIAHPVGDRDESLIVRRGADIAAECARVLTTRVAEIEREFSGRHYPLPRGVMPR